MEMRKPESLEEMVTRRNKRLLNLFVSNGFNVRLVGDEQKPAVIKEDQIVLSCYVKNFDLHFTKEPFSDETVKTVKLRSEPQMTRYELLEVLDMCTHRPVFKIKLETTDFYLVGYNYLNPDDGMGRYPVFAKHKPKVYFDSNFAEEVVKNLEAEGYKVSIE